MKRRSPGDKRRGRPVMRVILIALTLTLALAGCGVVPFVPIL